jgi:hypothetical protein
VGANTDSTSSRTKDVLVAKTFYLSQTRRVIHFENVEKRLLTHDLHCRADRLVAALDHALLVVAGGLIVGVDDGVGGHAVGVVGLGPGVDGVDVGVGVEEEGEHFCAPGKARAQLH